MDPESDGRGDDPPTVPEQTSNAPPLRRTASPEDRFSLLMNHRLELASMQDIPLEDCKMDREDGLIIWKGLNVRQQRLHELANLNLYSADECHISFITKPLLAYPGWRGNIQKNAIYPVNAVDVDELRSLTTVMGTRCKAWEGLGFALMQRTEFNQRELLLYWTPIFHGVVVPIKLLRGLLGIGIRWAASTKVLGLLEVPWAICKLMGVAEPTTSITKISFGTWNTSGERAMIGDMDATISSQLEYICAQHSMTNNDELREVVNSLYMHENIQKQWTAVLKLAEILGIDSSFEY